MFGLFWWGLFGSNLDEEWELEHPEEAAKQEYINQRQEYLSQLRKYPNAEKFIRQLDCEAYRKYVRKMLELGGSGRIEQFDDL